MFRKEYIRIESSTQHSSVNDFVVINIPDDRSIWESAKIVAPTPNYAIIQLDVDDNFVTNSTHLNMIRENKFDGYLWADPHDHIREFLAICNMFRYESITSWEQMRKAFINKFFPPSLFNRLLLEIRCFSQLTNPTQGILDEIAGGIFLYKSPNQAFQFLEDKVLFELDWSKKLQMKPTQKSVVFANGSNSNNDNSRLMEKVEALTIKMDSKFQSLKEEMHEMRYENRNSHDPHSHQSHHDRNDSEKSLKELNNDVRNDLEDFKRCIRSMRTVHWKLFARDDGKTTGVLPNKESKTVETQPKIDLEKSITKFLDSQKVTSMFVKNNVNAINLMMKQNKNNFQTKIKDMERKIDKWSKSQNLSSKQTDRTNPPPHPQAQTEHVNAVFIGSGKSDDSPKILKDPPPPIIVNNTIPNNKPIKTSKKSYYVEKNKRISIP
ncbi:hypothetical protein Tco_1319126 [Tanacetum coccineum]